MSRTISFGRIGTAVICIVSVVALMIGSPTNVFAMTNAQRKALDKGAYYFNTEDVDCTIDQTSSTNDSGVDANKPHIEQAFKYFVVNGFSGVQAAGIVGNLMVESGSGQGGGTALDPNAEGDFQNGVPTSYGIAQWHLGRKTNLLKWLAANNYAKDSFVGQLNYLMHELNTNYASFLTEFKKTTTPESAADYWDIHYEVSTAASRPLREKYAKSVYAQALAASPPWINVTGSGNLDDQTAVACATDGPGSTSPDCKTATGDPKILCEALKYGGPAPNYDKGNFYVFGAGHGGYDSFRTGCPLDSVAAHVAASTEAHPGPCATDCSSLVSIALDEAFGAKHMWVVSDISNGDHSGWVNIPMTSVKPGDVVTHNDSHGVGEHIEIVDYYDAANKRIHTFGSHQTGTRTGPSSSLLNHFYDHAWHWNGAGSTPATPSATPAAN